MCATADRIDCSFLPPCQRRILEPSAEANGKNRATGSKARNQPITSGVNYVSGCHATDGIARHALESRTAVADRLAAQVDCRYRFGGLGIPGDDSMNGLIYRRHLALLVRPFLLGVLLSWSSTVIAGDPALELFEQRIMPIFRSPKPSSCIQCH